MKVLTIGWLFVFFIMFLVNTFIFKSYISIPFKEFRTLKLSIYGGIHLALTAITIYYFYIYFSAKTSKKHTEKLSNIAGFHMTFLNYSMIFYLIYDLVYFTRNKIAYSDNVKIFGNKLFFGGFFVFGMAAILGFISLKLSKTINVKEYIVEIKSKKSKIDNLNVVYISDGHLNRYMLLNEIDELIKTVENLNPDILFLGGDFFDEGSTTFDKNRFSEKISKVKTKYGIYAVEGNHEYKSGNQIINHQMKYLKKNGITVLQDEELEIEDSFYIVGRRDKFGDRKKLGDVAKGSKEIPRIVLDHRPNFKESESLGFVDLQISGHTHNGQYFPLDIFNFIGSKLFKEYFYGEYKSDNFTLIVSSGIGNWGIPIRMGSRREILNIKIKIKK